METELYLQTLSDKDRDAFTQLAAVFAELEPLVENFLEAVRELWERIRAALREALAPILEAAARLYEDLQRAEVYTRLRAWHVPHWLAAPVSRYWPRRWLPDRLSYLFDKIEQKS